MRHLYDVIIIGGGPGGYTAALYAARAGLDTLVLEKLSAGGQMALTTQIDNYPGYEAGIDGFTLGEKMQQGAERFGAKTEIVEVDGVHLQGPVKTVHTNEGIFEAKTVILAMGAHPRKLGIPNEARLVGHGLHYCAACDGMFYKDKTVVVVGGGNSAAADALLLSRICKKVILVHRRDELRATKIYHQPLMQAENVEFQWNQTVESVLESIVADDGHDGRQGRSFSGGRNHVQITGLLSRICKKVILVHRRDELRATKIYHQPLMQAENVEFQWNQTVESVLESIVADDGHDGRQGRSFSGGRNHVQITGVRLKNAATGEKQEIVCDGIFVSVGREPETRMIENQVVLDENGYIIADESTKTNLPGVFAVGDIRTKALRQIVTATADGANAAYAVGEYLANK